jgi:hypothetical protein
MTVGQSAIHLDEMYILFVSDRQCYSTEGCNLYMYILSATRDSLRQMALSIRQLQHFRTLISQIFLVSSSKGF